MRLPAKIQMAMTTPVGKDVEDQEISQCCLEGKWLSLSVLSGKCLRKLKMMLPYDVTMTHLRICSDELKTPQCNNVCINVQNGCFLEGVVIAKS